MGESPAEKRERYRAYRRDWCRRNPEKVRRKNRNKKIKQKFGLTEADYAELYSRQGGVCGGCGQPETATRQGRVKALAVDHCHRTGRIRGLLCQCCNRAIGLLKDNPAILQRLIRYLQDHQ